MPSSKQSLPIKHLALATAFLLGYAASRLSLSWSHHIVETEVDLFAPTEWKNSNLPSSLNRPDTLILVSSVRTTANERQEKSLVYWYNFYYFVANGITCQEDVLFIVGEPIYDFVVRFLAPIKIQCERQGANISVLARENRCYDMESYRVALQHIGYLDSHYEYFLFVNDGLSGPKLPEHSTESWARSFTGMLNSQVKMAGLNINCRGHHNFFDPHVSSMMFVFDRIGLETILGDATIYNCRYMEKGEELEVIVTHFEIAMGQSILRAGYSLHGRIQNLTISKNSTPADCKYTDIWQRIEQYRWWGRLLSHNETMFHKSTRFIPDDVALEIGYDGVERTFSTDQSFWDVDVDAMAYGGATIMRFMDQPKLVVKYFVPKCSNPTRTMRALREFAVYAAPYLGGATIEIYSACDDVVFEGLESVLPNSKLVPLDLVSSYDSFIASQVLNMEVQRSRHPDKRADTDVILFVGEAEFLQPDPSFSLPEILTTAAVRGFGCKTKPPAPSNLRPGPKPTGVHIKELWGTFVASSLGATMDLRSWLSQFDATIQGSVVPVCYGSSFTLRRNQVGHRSTETWRALDVHLRSASKISQAYAERSWAALLANPFPEEISEFFISRAVSIYDDPADTKRAMPGMLLFRGESS